jgi:hypothetical protein
MKQTVPCRRMVRKVSARTQLPYGDRVAVDEGMVDARGPQVPSSFRAAGGGQRGGAEVVAALRLTVEVPPRISSVCPALRSRPVVSDP